MAATPALDKWNLSATLSRGSREECNPQRLMGFPSTAYGPEEAPDSAAALS